MLISDRSRHGTTLVFSLHLSKKMSLLLYMVYGEEGQIKREWLLRSEEMEGGISVGGQRP